MTKQLFTLKEIQAERKRIIDERDKAKEVLTRTQAEYPPLIWRALWATATEFYYAYICELDARFEVAQEWMMKQAGHGELPKAEG